MLESIKQIKCMKYTFKSAERIDNKILNATFETKINIQPLQLYIQKKESGQEILYSEGFHNNEVLINPNGFPYFNLSFSPFSSLMRKDAHHTIFETGFNYLGTIIDENLKKSNDLYTYITLNGETIFDGKTCYKLIMNYPEFNYYSYKMEKEQTLTSFAKKMSLNEFMIAEKNEMDAGSKLKKDTKILIPNLYAKKIIILVDKSSYLPISISIYDEKGLFEEYGFYNLKINPEMMKNDFSEDNEEYGF